MIPMQPSHAAGSAVTKGSTSGDVLTRLPFMTNHQISEVTPEAWCKARQAQKCAA